MATNNIKGLTVEIGGDTTKLGQALESVNKKSRDLSSELGQINKLLKMDPGNAELLAQKQKVLAEAVETTAEKLKTLKDAEKQVQKQFERGEVSEDQVRALQREIIATERKMESYEKAARETADAIDKLGDESEETSKEVDKLGDEAGETGRELDKAGDKSSTFGSRAQTAGQGAAGVFAAVAAAAAAAAAALTACSVAAATYADNILTASTVTGISTDKLQAYSYAAELVDVSVETLTKSHAKNIKSMKAAKDGTKLAVEAYEQLGVTVTNADGSLRDGETVYWEVIDALGAMENETERDALAMQILGKSAQELNPLIEAGSARMNELTQEARDVGAVLSEDALNSLGSFDDSLQRLTGSAGAAKNALGSVLLPELTALTTGGAELLSEFTRNLNATGGGIEGFIATVDLMAEDIGQKAGDLIGGIIDKASALLPAVVNVGIKLVVELATAVVEKLPDLVQTIVKVLIDSIPALLDGATKLLLAILDAIPLILPPLIEAIPDIVNCIIDGLLDAIPQLIDGALLCLLGIVDAIPLLIEELVPLIPEIVNKICLGLVDSSPKLLSAALQLFFAIQKAIPKACVSLLKSLPQIWQTISSYLKQLPGKVLTIGGDLVKGLWQGISDKVTWLKNKIKSWVGDVTKFIKRLFGINSPSKVTAYMGEMLDEGLAKGVEDNAKAPTTAMRDVSQEMLGEVGSVDGLSIERHINHSYTADAAAAAAQNAGLLGKLEQILRAIEQGQILAIDGDALVGATANRMNKALGQRRVLAGRGAV